MHYLKFPIALLPIVVLVWPVHAAMPPVNNFAKAVVSTGYNSSATSVVLFSGHGAKFPSTFPYQLVWWNCTDYGAPEDDSFVEIVNVTGRTGDTLTVVRGYESTAPQNHNTGGKSYCMVQSLTAGMWDAIRADIAAVSGGAAMILSGAGDPEGAVTAGVGTLYLRTGFGHDLTLYTKQQTGNIGWAVLRSIPLWESPGPIGSLTPFTGRFTDLEGQRLILGFPWPTYGATIVIDAALGNAAKIIATNNNNFAIANPLNAFYGQQLSIMVANTSGGALGTITWDTRYKMATFTKPASGTTRTVTFLYDGTNWIEINCSPEVPN